MCASYAVDTLISYGTCAFIWVLPSTNRKNRATLSKLAGNFLSRERWNKSTLAKSCFMAYRCTASDYQKPGKVGKFQTFGMPGSYLSVNEIFSVYTSFAKPWLPHFPQFLSRLELLLSQPTLKRVFTWIWRRLYFILNLRYQAAHEKKWALRLISTMLIAKEYEVWNRGNERKKKRENKMKESIVVMIEQTMSHDKKILVA